MPLRALLLVLFAAWPAGAGELAIASSGGQPPIAEIGPGGEPAGLERALADLLCARLAADCTVTATDWRGLVAGLQERRFDLGFAALSRDTVEGLGLAASVPWLALPSRFVARAGEAPAGDPLAPGDGPVIGVLRGTPHALWLEARLPADRLVRYGDEEAMYLALLAGRVDLLFGDVLALWRGLLATPLGAGVAIAGPPVALDGGGADLVFALPPGSPLKPALDAALAGLERDGTLAGLVAHHLPGLAPP